MSVSCGIRAPSNSILLIQQESQDRTLMDRARTMTMTAAAGYGSDVQVHTTESIAQDFGDGNDASCYFCESLIFPVFCGCSSVQNLKLRGAMEASKASKLHPTHKTLWAYLSSSNTCSEGGVRKCEHVRWTPCRIFPAGRR